jgi:DNA ligase 1
MQLAEIVHTSHRVASASGRLEKIALLAECLRRLPPEEIEPGVGFLTGDLRQGRIGVGAAALRNAAAGSGPPACGATLSVADVDRAFQEIARTSGRGSGQRRTELLRELFGRATPAEREFLIRLVLGELRQGALEGVMIEAVARAAAVPAGSVRRAAMFAGDLRAVACVALTEGAEGLQPIGLQLFRPIQPMLAQTADDVGEALQRIGEAALEFKLDGARVQVHKTADAVRVYSRSLNDVTVAVPELVEHVRRLPARELILDGEVLALRPDGTPHPFQTTMRRFGRRLDVDALRRTLPLVPYFFDCLWADGEPLVDRPAGERMAELSARLPGELIIPRRVVAGADDGRAFLEQALRRGHEGLVAKSLTAAYEAGQRGAGWLKIKPAHTLDLVVLAVEWGHGRRHGWLSNLHLGARDPASGGFAMLGKTFKGLTDEMLAWQTARLLELEISRDEWTVYVRPELVVEVAFNNVQHSPHYASGLALRFARVKRYRSDKIAAEADTVETVRAIFEHEHRG